MPPLAERQGDFAAALLNPALPIPDGLVDPDGEPGRKRFAVYRNNVLVSLIEALKDGFPAVHRLVGDDFFCAMARAYAVVQPPRSPILIEYGAGFADFIGTFEPTAPLPYLADVARIERAWVEAYHAAEASPIDPEALTKMTPEQCPAAQLVLHPSLRLVRSLFPALTIWRMNVEGGLAAPVDLAAGGEDVLIIRPHADVEVRSIPRGSFEFIQALTEGQPVLAAYEASRTIADDFDLAANLFDLISTGAVIGCNPAADRRRG